MQFLNNYDTIFFLSDCGGAQKVVSIIYVCSYSYVPIPIYRGGVNIPLTQSFESSRRPSHMKLRL